MKILIVAPHPDDEILGVGGTILKRKFQGYKIGWLIITRPGSNLGWDNNRINQRNLEIKKIKELMGFDEVFKLQYESGSLDLVPLGNLINSISDIITRFKPEEVFLPHGGDVHSDHVIVNKAVISSSKSFRQPFIKRLISYETISETEFGLDRSRMFSPNLYIDITKFINQKIEALEIYKNEIGEFPFPRSKEALISLAKYRGTSSGMNYAEAFEILKSIE